MFSTAVSVVSELCRVWAFVRYRVSQRPFMQRHEGALQWFTHLLQLQSYGASCAGFFKILKKLRIGVSVLAGDVLDWSIFAPFRRHTFSK